MTVRKEIIQRVNQQWSFLWPCASCQKAEVLYLVTESEIAKKVFGRCAFCTTIVEVDDRHRDRRMF